MNVCHISDLRNNLLSLGALEAHGCKFSGADGGIKVTKGSMIILKEEQIVILYKMIGSVIVDDVSKTLKKEDTTRLWHMRLEYIS